MFKQFSDRLDPKCVIYLQNSVHEVHYGIFDKLLGRILDNYKENFTSLISALLADITSGEYPMAHSDKWIGD